MKYNRKNILFALLFTLSLAFCVIPVGINAETEEIYDCTGDKNVTNPFPEVITAAEVNELQNKTKSAYPFPCIVKTFSTPAGKEFRVVNGKGVGDTEENKELFIPYMNRPGRIDIYIFIPRVDRDGVYDGDGEIRLYKSSREFTYPDGSTDFDDNKAPQRNIPYTLEINNRLIGSDITRKIKIKYNMRKNQTFIHVTMYLSKDDEAIFGGLSLNYEGSAAAPGFHGWLPLCSAQFHFVDDLFYRWAVNIAGSSEIPQRSAGETDHFSTRPFKSLDLPDLTEPKVVSRIRFVNNQSFNPYFVPLLSFDQDPKKTSVPRPTMQELTGTSIPGYLYYGNDIDTPAGGQFTATNTQKIGNYDYGVVRDKDDNLVTEKHYYLTFRPEPTRLVVRYKDLQNKFETGKPFALYTQNRLISNKLISNKLLTAEDPEPPTKAALQKMIQTETTTLLSGAAGYLAEGFAYLAPGEYLVEPNIAPPQGYEWVEEGSDPFSPAGKATVAIAAHKKETDPTQKTVTFVLRRKLVAVRFISNNRLYANVRVQKSSSIDGDELTTESMPAEPSKEGYVFKEWNTAADGKGGTTFTGSTVVNDDMTVFAIFVANPYPQPGPPEQPIKPPEKPLKPNFPFLPVDCEGGEPGDDLSCPQPASLIGLPSWHLTRPLTGSDEAASLAPLPATGERISFAYRLTAIVALLLSGMTALARCLHGRMPTPTR